jgi:hypothetical protein
MTDAPLEEKRKSPDELASAEPLVSVSQARLQTGWIGAASAMSPKTQKGRPGLTRPPQLQNAELFLRTRC